MIGKPIKKGQRLSPKTEFKKGMVPFMKDRKHSEESKIKMSISHKGKIPWNKGKKRPPFSKEWKLRMGLAHKGRIYKNRGVPRFFQRGEKSPTWKGGVSTLQNIERNRIEYKNWRKEVYTRDSYKCKKCGVSKNLHAHHIKTFSKFPKLRYVVSNGLTLCQVCHSKVHGRLIPNMSRVRKFKSKIL